MEDPGESLGPPRKASAAMRTGHASGWLAVSYYEVLLLILRTLAEVRF